MRYPLQYTENIRNKINIFFISLKHGTKYFFFFLLSLSHEVALKKKKNTYLYKNPNFYKLE